jgi:hypothetical protein
MVKLPLLLSLIGGVARVDACGTRIRGESHCLIIGDPGLGKSQVHGACAVLPSDVWVLMSDANSAQLFKDQFTKYSLMLCFQQPDAKYSLILENKASESSTHPPPDLLGLVRSC